MKLSSSPFTQPVAVKLVCGTKKAERFKPFYRYKTIRGNKNIFVDLLIIEQPKHPGAVAYSNLDLLYLTSAVCKNGSFCGCHTATGKRGQATNEERVF